DAFDADYIPEHLLTVEFLRSVQAIRVPGGAVVANTFLGGPLPAHEAATYQAVFTDVYQVVSGGNRILLAGAPLAPMQQMRGNAQRLEQALQRFDVSAPSLAARLEPVPRTDARPFTDRGGPARVRRRRRGRRSDPPHLHRLALDLAGGKPAQRIVRDPGCHGDIGRELVDVDLPDLVGAQAEFLGQRAQH